MDIPIQIALDLQIVVPILTLVAREQDSFETVRSNAGNAVKNRVCIASLITTVLLFGWIFDSGKIFECSLVDYFSIIGFLTYLVACILRDVYFLIQLRTITDPRRLVVQFTKFQLTMDSGYLLLGLPTSVIAMLF